MRIGEHNFHCYNTLHRRLKVKNNDDHYASEMVCEQVRKSWELQLSVDFWAADCSYLRCDLAVIEPSLSRNVFIERKRTETAKHPIIRTSFFSASSQCMSIAMEGTSRLNVLHLALGFKPFTKQTQRPTATKLKMRERFGN